MAVAGHEFAGDQGCALSLSELMRLTLEEGRLRLGKLICHVLFVRIKIIVNFQ